MSGAWEHGSSLERRTPLSAEFTSLGVRSPGGEWRYRSKLSEESAKASCPGSLQVRRFYQRDGKFLGDAIYEIDHGVSEPCEIVDFEGKDTTRMLRCSSHSD